MADAMKCDRCGKYYEIDGKNNSFKHHARIYNVFVFNPLTTDWVNSIDLCPDCQDEFEEWMKNKTDWDKIANEITVINCIKAHEPVPYILPEFV